MYLINCGSFRGDGGVMYGGIPRRVWQRADSPDSNNRCKMAVNVVLAKVGDRVILMDCGVGDVHLDYIKCYGFEGDGALHHRLISDCGIGCEEVTDVIFSHLHFDHCGGAVRRNSLGEIVATFPQARHWVSGSQYRYSLSPSCLDADSFVSEDIKCLARTTDWRLVEDALDIASGVSLHLFDGHTFGQIVTEFCTNNGTFFFVGDTIPTKNHFKKRWGSGYDLEPLKTVSSKLSISELASNTRAGLIFAHEQSFPMSRCSWNGVDYRLEEYVADLKECVWIY